jgi:large subunit ribosomal protein L23
MNYSGKIKTRYTRTSVTKGRTNHYKKAVVTLAAGETIDFYSNI